MEPTCQTAIFISRNAMLPIGIEHEEKPTRNLLPCFSKNFVVFCFELVYFTVLFRKIKKNIQSILFLKLFRMKKKKEFPNYSVILVTKKKTLNLTVFEKTGYFEACPKAS
jgi:hypothetical protein